jgi:hypothetical protein
MARTIELTNDTIEELVTEAFPSPYIVDGMSIRNAMRQVLTKRAKNGYAFYVRVYSYDTLNDTRRQLNETLQNHLGLASEIEACSTLDK